ncbi:MAG: HAD family hydrolase [Bacteroidetes bacterium]|nr:HAD family hydrolase [Bacteroidota bacterium]
MQFFFDLDGTLINAKPRVYQLFQKLVPESTLSFDAYWEKKMQQIGHAEMLSGLGYTETDIKQFQNEWHAAIEQPEWLALDTPFEGVNELLKTIAENHKLYIVTSRQFQQPVVQQVNSFGWTDIVTDVLVTCQQKEKYELISQSTAVSSNDWMIGDTGKDIQTGKALGIKTAAVLSGFRNKESLSKYNPDLIIDNVTLLPLV